MKRFLRDISIFALMVLAVLVTAEVYVRQLPNPARDKHEWMLQHAPEVNTLVLGSSHTFYGVNPAELGDSAYSLAMVSQTYRYDHWLLHRYHFSHLRNVILPFSYFSLYEDDEQGVSEQIASRYRIYMDCDLHAVLSKYNFEFTQFSSFKEKLKSLYQPQQLSWNERGWGSNYTYENRSENWDNGEARAVNNTYPDTSAVALNLHFLEGMAQWCREHQAQLHLVTTPVSQTFLQHQDTAQTRRNQRLLRAFLVKHPEVHYLNLESDSRFVDEDFYDADHLSDRGAQKLTQLLKKEM